MRGLEIPVEGMRIITVDHDLGKKRKSHVVVQGAEALDVHFVVRLLAAELVAGKAEYYQPLIPVANMALIMASLPAAEERPWLF